MLPADGGCMISQPGRSVVSPPWRVFVFYNAPVKSSLAPTRAFHCCDERCNDFPAHRALQLYPLGKLDPAQELFGQPLVTLKSEHLRDIRRPNP